MREEVELRHLRYFVAVAEELHFGRAAQRLHMAQPPLSQQIRKLEQTIGHALFTRTTRGVALTAAGDTLLERARRTLAKVHDDLNIVRRVGSGESGTLTVGFAGSAILTALPEALRRYRQKYPGVELRLSEMFTSHLTAALLDGIIDVAFLRDPGSDPRITHSTLLQENYVAVLPSAHRLTRRRSIPVRALAGEPVVLFPPAAGSVAHGKIVDLCTHSGFAPNIVQEAPHWQTVVRLVEAGFGVSIAPACVARMSWKGVAHRKLIGTSVTTDVVLGLRRDERAGTAKGFASVARLVYREAAV